MKNMILAIGCAMFMAGNFNAYGASFQKAEMLNQQGLVSESKAELVEVIFSKAVDAEKTQAYFLLGSIAFSEKKVSTALETWKQLVKKYPTSQEATLVQDRIKQLAEIVGEMSKESVDNAIAESYLKHGDFWSQGKDYKFTIDTSWIPNVEAANKWYDKVIKEFPRTKASRVAYEEKMRTLLGWKEPGRDGNSYGVKNNYRTYMPELLETFSAFEKEHPDAPSLQAFRYQIGQAWWSVKGWEESRKWFNLVIEKSGDSDSFYKDAATRRLQKIEY